MLGAGRVLALSTVLAAFATTASCASHEEDVAVRVGPTVLFPRGILDSVTKLTLRVYDTSVGATCDVDTGIVGGNLDRLFIEQDLVGDGCPEGVRFCGDVRVRRSSTAYLFSVVAEDAKGRNVANGCVEDRIDEPRRDLAIQMHRFIEPAECGNGKLEPTELCDPPDAPDKSVCDASCKTLDVLLSGGKGDPGGTARGNPGDKTNPVAVWPAGKAGQDTNFLVFFTDKTPASREITMRVRSDAFGRFNSSLGDAASDYSFFLPHDPSATFPPTELPANQSAPAAIRVDASTWVAYEDDAAGDVDIRLRSIDATFVSEQPTGPFLVSGSGNTPDTGSQTKPAVAVNNQGVMFVAWQDDNKGSIGGRAFTPPNTLGAKRALSVDGTNSRNVRIAGRDTGFVAVWEAGSEIRLAFLSSDGVVATEQKVNGANRTGPVSHPDIAVLPDGRFAVVYSDRGEIFIQRFAKDGKPIAGDQDVPVNTVADGDQRSPVVAAMSSFSGSYAVAWISNGNVRAAYLGGDSGILFNPVDAQPTEFGVNAAQGGGCDNPSIVVGGSGPFIAVVWEDNTASAAKAGIYGRRLPLPLE